MIATHLYTRVRLLLGVMPIVLLKAQAADISPAEFLNLKQGDERVIAWKLTNGATNRVPVKVVNEIELRKDTTWQAFKWYGQAVFSPEKATKKTYGYAYEPEDVIKLVEPGTGALNRKLPKEFGLISRERWNQISTDKNRPKVSIITPKPQTSLSSSNSPATSATSFKALIRAAQQNQSYLFCTEPIPALSHAGRVIARDLE